MTKKEKAIKKRFIVRVDSIIGNITVTCSGLSFEEAFKSLQKNMKGVLRPLKIISEKPIN